MQDGHADGYIRDVGAAENYIGKEHRKEREKVM